MEREFEGNWPIRPASHSDDAPVSGGVGGVLKRGVGGIEKTPEVYDREVAKLMQEK